jgi:hypothetical protein
VKNLIGAHQIDPNHYQLHRNDPAHSDALLGPKADEQRMNRPRIVHPACDHRRCSNLSALPNLTNVCGSRHPRENHCLDHVGCPEIHLKADRCVPRENRFDHHHGMADCCLSDHRHLIVADPCEHRQTMNVQKN